MDIFKSLLKAEQAEQVTADLAGRAFGCSIAVVADIDDPAKLGRIRVLLASNGAKSLTDWLVRLTPSKLLSVPLVAVGDTVVVSFFNGDPKAGAYLGVVNNLPQPPVASDQGTLVSVNGETFIYQSKEKVIITCGTASMTLDNAGNFALSNITQATINDKPIMVIGGKDSRGDRMVTSGI